MLQLVVGYLAGSATVIIAVRIMNQKLSSQKRHYDSLLGDSTRKVNDLSNRDAFRQGREFEANEQRRYRMQLREENEALRADNNDLRHQLGLECVFDHKLKTLGQATVQVR